MLGGAHNEGEATGDKKPQWDAGALSCAALQRGGKPCAVTGAIEREFKFSTRVRAAGRGLSQPRALGTILHFCGSRCEPPGLC